MEYSINSLAKLAGVSARTLRYYDQINLLKPLRINSSGYRIYGQDEINQLQQILFFRELGVKLDDIKEIINTKNFNNIAALQTHLSALLAKRSQLDLLIANVEKTIEAEKGEIVMTDTEKFAGFTQKLVEKNEEEYGEEIREKYGNAAIEKSNAKIKGMSKEKYAEVELLSKRVNDALEAAFKEGNPAGELAQNACELHKEWLCCFWDSYSKQAHIGVTQMYVDDPRFTAYYDKIAIGCAKFLRDAVAIYCK